MSKITPAIVKDQQFLPEHFNPVADFDTWLQSVIDSQEALLVVRIGSLYDSAETAISTQVKSAALAMICDDLTQRRILRLSGNISEDTSAQISALMKIRDSYRQSAASAIDRLNNSGASADTSGYAGSTLVSDNTSLLSGWPA